MPTYWQGRRWPDVAIFHLSHKFISRGQGQSVVAAAAYQSRGRLRDDQTGQVKDYTRKAEQALLFSGVFAPKDAPAWARDRERLWNAAEQAEDTYNRTRAKTARTGQHLEISLPYELTAEQNRYALQDFIKDHFTRHGYAVDLNIHGPDKGGDSRNVHAHLLITTRTLTPEGFNPQKPRFDHKAITEQANRWREGWAKTANRHLERYGHEARIDHRSLEAQGLEREASQHLGPTATRMERDGKASDRGEENRQGERRRQNRAHLRALHNALAHTTQEIEAEESRLLAVRLTEIERPTVGLWKATRGRESTTPAPAPPKPASLFSGLALALTSKEAALTRPTATRPPARPLEPTNEQAQNPQPNESRIARLMRERDERWKREREEARQQGRSRVDDWLDGMHKKSDGPP